MIIHTYIHIYIQVVSFRQATTSSYFQFHFELRDRNHWINDKLNKGQFL